MNFNCFQEINLYFNIISTFFQPLIQHIQHFACCLFSTYFNMFISTLLTLISTISYFNVFQRYLTPGFTGGIKNWVVNYNHNKSLCNPDSNESGKL